MSYELNAEDLILYGGDQPMATGFKVNSILYGGNNFTNVYDKNQSGGAASTLFENLAVPAGLFLTQNYAKKKYYKKNDKGYISDNFHNRLLGLVSPTNNAKTRKKRGGGNNKTKRKIER